MGTSIFINCCGGLGDCVYFSRSLTSLVKQLPEVKLQILTWEKNLPVFSRVPNIQKLHNGTTFFIDCQNKRLDPFQIGERLSLLSKDHDILINLQPQNNYKAWIKASKAPLKVGLNVPLEDQTSYQKTFQTNPNEHIYSTYQRLLEGLFNTKLQEQPFQMKILQHHKETAQAILTHFKWSSETPLVIVHPGCTGTSKLWDYFKWAELITWLINQFQSKVILIGSHLSQAGGEPCLDEPICEIIHRLCSEKTINLAGQTKDLSLLSAIILNCHLYIGLDTGPTHIASELGKPTLDLYHFTKKHIFEAWKLIQPQSTTLSSSPLKTLPVEEVKNAINTLNALPKQ